MSSHIDRGIIERLQSGPITEEDMKSLMRLVAQLRDKVDFLREQNTRLLSKIQEYEAREY